MAKTKKKVHHINNNDVQIETHAVNTQPCVKPKQTTKKEERKKITCKKTWKKIKYFRQACLSTKGITEVQPDNEKLVALSFIKDQLQAVS